MPRVKIEVTEKDIVKGEKMNPEFCPIARAVRRRIRSKSLMIGGWEMRENGLRVANLPKKAVDFMSKFDSGATVKPFVFTLNLPANFKERMKNI